MAAPSSNVPVAASPAHTNSGASSDDGALTCLREVSSGGGTVLLDEASASASEAAGLMQEVPIVGNVCTAFLVFEQLVITARSNQGDFATLRDLCDGGIKRALNKRNGRPGLLEEEFTKLKEHVLAAVKLAELCSGDRRRDKLKRAALAPKISKDIAAVKSHLLALCTVVNSGAGDDTHAIGSSFAAVLADKRSNDEALAAEWRELEDRGKIADLASRVKIPAGAPRIRDWYVERTALVAQACDLLGIGQGGNTLQAPIMVGLAGPSGAGKSTVAAMVIRRNDARAYFEKGVLWLQVGQGAKDRLLELKSSLATMVYETVLRKSCRPPRKQLDLGSDPEDGVDYIVDVTSNDRLRFLVVADDVWDVEVLQELKRAGAWVLYTTRQDDLLPEYPQPLRLDQVLRKEAELVLRRAADLDDDARLPEAAYKLMEGCIFAALDLAFVGRWNDVRGRSGNDEKAWRTVFDRIVVETQESSEDGRPLSWRAAVFRAGLDELHCDNPKNKELYVSLAVIPKGLAFSPEVAAVLLYGSGFSAGDLEAAEGVVVALERWSILLLEDSGKYRIHDEHLGSIQGRGIANQGIRERALTRWREYASSIRALSAFSSDWLVEIWSVLLRVESTGAMSRPYEAGLDAMETSNTVLAKALDTVAHFHRMREDWSEAYSKSSRLLKIQEDGVGWNRLGVAKSPNKLGVCAADTEMTAERLYRRALAIWEDKLGASHPHVAHTLHNIGVCAEKAGRTKEAEKLYRRALAIREDNLGLDHPHVASTLHKLGLCADLAGRTEEARRLFRRALTIREHQLGVDHPNVADTLHNLGGCVAGTGRMEEADMLFRRALSIREEKLCIDHPDVADTLYNLGVCAGKAGRTEEAETLYRRALVIWEDKLGIAHLDVAHALYNVGECADKTGRTREAETLYRRALAIQEGNLGVDDAALAGTLYNLGVCVGKAGRTEEAVMLFRRALSIREDKLGVDHPDVADTLFILWVCTEKSGRTEEAEKLYRRALAIREKKLGADHPDLAITLYNLGVCAFDAGRTEEAETLYRRALAIREDTLGIDHPDVALTLLNLGVCVDKAGRTEDAEKLHERALSIWEETLGVG